MMASMHVPGHILPIGARHRQCNAHSMPPLWKIRTAEDVWMISA
jgi:hypothetical protein